MFCASGSQAQNSDSMLSAALHGGEPKAPAAAPAPAETGETYFGVKLNKAAFPGLFEDDSKPEDYVPGLLEKLSLVDVKMEPIYKVASSVDGKPRVCSSLLSIARMRVYTTRRASVRSLCVWTPGIVRVSARSGGG